MVVDLFFLLLSTHFYIIFKFSFIVIADIQCCCCPVVGALRQIRPTMTREERERERKNAPSNDMLSKISNVMSFFSLSSLFWHTTKVIQTHVSERSVYVLFRYIFFHSFLISSQSLCRSVIFLHKFDRTVKLVGYFRIKKTFIVISQRMKMA